MSAQRQEVAGETRVFDCSCGQGACYGQLLVIPLKINGEKRIDIRTLGIGGTVLSATARRELLEILSDDEWFGDPLADKWEPHP